MGGGEDVVWAGGSGDCSEPGTGPVAGGEGAAGASGVAGVLTDSTVAGCSGPLLGLTATANWGQCCVAS